MESVHLLPLLLCYSCLLLHCPSLAFALQPQLQPLEFTEENPLPLGRPRTEIFHEPTGLCILRRSLTDPLKLGPCEQSDSWIYTPQSFLEVRGTYFCLQALQPGKPVKLGIICELSDSQWLLMVSDSQKTHLATKLADGTFVCLDVDSNGTIVSNLCNGFESAQEEYLGSDSQWFKLVSDNKKVPPEVDFIKPKLQSA